MLKNYKTLIFIAFSLMLSIKLYSQPNIISVSPAKIVAGQNTTIIGSQLVNISQVKLNTRIVSINTILYNNNDTLVLQIPNNTVKGLYDLSFKSGTITGNNFPIEIIGPTIKSTNISMAEIDDRIIISTSNVDTVLSVQFGNTKADLLSIRYLNGPNQFSVKIPKVNSIGNYPIFIQTKYDNTEAFPFTISGLNLPSITNISPKTAAKGEKITITGKNFNSITGITFGNTLAKSGSFNILDSNTITILIPFLSLGENSIKVYSESGESELFPFQVKPETPQITSFFPQEAKIGNSVTILGTNLQNISAIVIGETTTMGLNFISNGSLSFIVPNKASSSKIKLVSPGGLTESSIALNIDTTTSVRSNIEYYETLSELIQIKLSDPNYIELYLKSEFNSIVIVDFTGRTIYSSTKVEAGTVKIPVVNDCSNLIIITERNQKYLKFKLGILR